MRRNQNTTVSGRSYVLFENLETRRFLSASALHVPLTALVPLEPGSSIYATTTPATKTVATKTPVTKTPVTKAPKTHVVKVKAPKPPKKAKVPAKKTKTTGQTVTTPVTAPVVSAPVTTPAPVVTTPTVPTTPTTPVTTAPTTPVSTTPSAPTPPIAGNWTMAFDDEFNSATISPTWHSAQWWSQSVTVVGQGELEAYAPSGVSQSDGQLHLTATKDTTYGTPYVSGIASTSDKFSFEYGYMEVSAKIPAGQGLFPAIWMLPASHNDSDGEIDVMEALGSDPSTAYFTVHHLAINKVAQQTETGVDLSAGFHTFGVDWEPNSITWYLDGKVVAVCTDPTLIPHEAMYPIMDLAVGGSWAGAPSASTPFPSSMDIDYIRIWQSDAA